MEGRTALNYPATARVGQIDDYHGTKIADPYRWLENDTSPETAAWVEAQNRVTSGYLAEIPQREKIRERIRQLWNYERYGVPFKKGGRYFFSRNDGLQNQGVIYHIEQLDGEPELLLDPNTLSADGTVALSDWSISEDGALMAYSLSYSGSDWQEWRVRDVRTGEDHADVLSWAKFTTASWRKNGFYYSRYDEPENANSGVNYYHKLYFHVLGQPQSADTLVYERPDQKEWWFSGRVTDDDRYLIITVWQGTENRNRVFYQDLRQAGAPVVELLNDFDAAYHFIDNDGSLFWFQTDLDAPRGRILGIDLAKPRREDWREVLPQAPETLQSASLINDQFVVLYLKDAHSQVKIFTRDGALARELDLPGIGTAGGFAGRRTDTETFYSFTRFASPGINHHLDLTTGRSTVFRAPKIAFSPDDFETRQVFYPGRDGTRIPMFITYKKGLVLDGQNPTYLYGYGGFSVSITPGFSLGMVVWMERGGIFATPNLRGGGEYGEEWHQAGMKQKKQTVFDDFIAAAEWLIAAKYTSTPRLAIVGGSNGGLLVGACLTQRPDLFGAAVAEVGVLDMLRFHQFTIGWAWISEFGSANNAEEFQVLHSYSPLHNLHAGTAYPATLITTSDHDDRVVPAHSFKFAAALQAAQGGSKPVLIRVETKAGHGGGKPMAKLIDETADKLAFLERELGVTGADGGI